MAAGKCSTSPECSDGADASSAPSEFLAEFLSAIMRRQYAEALKYCQLILRYEPHNATAQGFYPLLTHKLRAHPPHPAHTPHAADDTSSSEDTSSRRAGLFAAHTAHHQKSHTAPVDEDEDGDGDRDGDGDGEDMSRSSSRSGSGSLCSSLELDSSSPRRSPPGDCTDPSDRTDRTDRTDPSDGSWRWESGGERSERDDNGNPAPAPAPPPAPLTLGGVRCGGEAAAADAENNTAEAAEAAAVTTHTKVAGARGGRGGCARSSRAPSSEGRNDVLC